MLDKAVKFASDALEGITSPVGEPYISHALRVMEQMDTEEEKMAAVLHDVLEDTEMTVKDLEAEGFPRKVIEIVAQFNKRRDMTYYDYIDDICCSEMATKIKLAEVEDNQDVFRVNKMSFKTYSLEERTRRTILILKGEFYDKIK